MSQFVEIRKKIEQLTVFSSKAGELSKASIINSILAEHREVLGGEIDNLIRVSLNKLVNEVFNHKNRTRIKGRQLDLFSAFPYVPFVTQLSKTVSSQSDQKGLYLTDDLRRSTLKFIVAEHDELQRNKRNRKIDSYRRILESTDDTDDDKTLKELLTSK